MFNWLFSYDFLVVTVALSILSLSSGLIGCFSVYQGKSLIGDAVGHATYPGILVAFILTQSRSTFILTAGAVVFAWLAYVSIHWLTKKSILRFDAALAIVLTGFFGLGMVLKTWLQGNPHFQNSAQAGLSSYVFGQSAFIMLEDLWTIIPVAIVTIGGIWLFFKEIKVCVFDKTYAQVIGINVNFIDTLLLFLMIINISVGIKSVGVILIASFLIMPCVLANQLTKKIKVALAIACGSGIIASLLGSIISILFDGLSTGPSIILVLGSMTFIAMIFGKYGLLARRRSLHG